MQIYSFSPFGYEGSLVTVEVDLRRGIPAIDIVGLADGAVKESRERMRAAIVNSGFEFPPERVLISLSPADLKKEGAGFDLAVALGVLCAKSDGFIDFPVLIMGELELSGRIRPVRGVHAAASTAVSAGITHCIVPYGNGNEAREISGMKVFQAETLQEAFYALQSEDAFTQSDAAAASGSWPDGAVEIEGVWFPPLSGGMGYDNFSGQEKLIRALCVAAAGGHNLLAFGSPGCGKTLALQNFPALLPYLTVDEAQPVTRIHSIAGLLSPKTPLVRLAPFRMPHQTSSVEGMCGGGPNCRPGEISLAHNGTLFLDEGAEFRSSVLQMLRVPLESGRITISRAGRCTTYPAAFQLLIATNPCPCGNYGSDTKICLCSARAVDLYWKKFSGPLLDRIDIRVKVDNESNNQAARQVENQTDNKSNNQTNNQSENKSDNQAASADSSIKNSGRCWNTSELRKKIAKAVFAQRTRQGIKNAHLDPEQISAYCRTNPDARSLLEAAQIKYGFSSRATASCLKLARTISDMEGHELIEKSDMQEAVDLRKVEGGLDS